MESNSLDINGSELVVSPSSSYKQISPKDVEEGLMSSKQKVSALVEDGLDEKMIPKEDSKLISEKCESDVKFISEEKQNGDAKVDIGEVKVGFVGMGKEELMKYANDPFWVRLRWILFILFWLVWALMLAGAVVIIIAAPKCAPPEPRTWWEQGPLVEVDTTVLSSKLLDQLKEQGVQGVIVAGGEDAYDASDVEILTPILKSGLNAIVELRPGSSARWLNQSEHKDPNYDEYYIWADQKGSNASGLPIPPNNWLSPLGGSAWKYSETRQKFYLAQMGEPDLNFWNSDVVDEFSAVIRRWLEAGARGIRLAGLDMLLVDREIRDEDPGFQGTNVLHEDYRFYTHKYTRNQPNTYEVLAVWRNVLMNVTNNEGVLLPAEDIEISEPYKINDTLLLDLPRYSAIFNFSNRQPSAEQIYNGLVSAKSALGKDAWPAWQYVPGGLPSDVLDIIIMLLPGTPVFSLNGSAPLTVDSALLQARHSPAIMFGSFESYLLNNNSIFAYTREKSGNPGHLVICNPTFLNVTVDFSPLKNISTDLTVVSTSQAYHAGILKPKSHVRVHEVTAPPISAIVLTYVPKTE